MKEQEKRVGGSDLISVSVSDDIRDKCYCLLPESHVRAPAAIRDRQNKEVIPFEPLPSSARPASATISGAVGTVAEGAAASIHVFVRRCGGLG